jgi:hypothetical protein
MQRAVSRIWFWGAVGLGLNSCKSVGKESQVKDLVVLKSDGTQILYFVEDSKIK